MLSGQAHVATSHKSYTAEFSEKSLKRIIKTATAQVAVLLFICGLPLVIKRGERAKWQANIEILLNFLVKHLGNAHFHILFYRGQEVKRVENESCR